MEWWTVDRDLWLSDGVTGDWWTVNRDLRLSDGVTMDWWTVDRGLRLSVMVLPWTGGRMTKVGTATHTPSAYTRCCGDSSVQYRTCTTWLLQLNPVWNTNVDIIETAAGTIFIAGTKTIMCSTISTFVICTERQRQKSFRKSFCWSSSMIITRFEPHQCQTIEMIWYQFMCWDQNVVVISIIHLVNNSTYDKNSLCMSRLQRVHSSGVEQSSGHCAFV